jgi:archaellum component FlaC
MSDLMMINKNLYISSIKALHVYLEQLTHSFLHVKQQFPEEQSLLEDLQEQIEIVSSIAEALTMAGSPPKSDPSMSN